MGHITQIILEVNIYQTRVTLRQLEIALRDRVTFGSAATEIKEVSKNRLEMIQKYFQAKAR